MFRWINCLIIIIKMFSLGWVLGVVGVQVHGYMMAKIRRQGM